MKHQVSISVTYIPLPPERVIAWRQALRVCIDLARQAQLAGVVVDDQQDKAEVERISLFTNSQCMASVPAGIPEKGAGGSENSHYATFPGVLSTDLAPGGQAND